MKSRRFVKKQSIVVDLFDADVQSMKEFISLVKGLLAYDPSRRLSAEKALSHPFFATEHPDEMQFK